VSNFSQYKITTLVHGLVCQQGLSLLLSTGQYFWSSAGQASCYQRKRKVGFFNTKLQ